MGKMLRLLCELHKISLKNKISLRLLTKNETLFLSAKHIVSNGENMGLGLTVAVSAKTEGTDIDKMAKPNNTERCLYST